LNAIRAWWESCGLEFSERIDEICESWKRIKFLFKSFPISSLQVQFQINLWVDLSKELCSRDSQMNGCLSPSKFILKGFYKQALFRVFWDRQIFIVPAHSNHFLFDPLLWIKTNSLCLLFSISSLSGESCTPQDQKWFWKELFFLWSKSQEEKESIFNQRLKGSPFSLIAESKFFKKNFLSSSTSLTEIMLFDTLTSNFSLWENQSESPCWWTILFRKSNRYFWNQTN